MVGVRTLEQFTEPNSLRSRVPRKVQNDGGAAGEEGADVIRESSTQARREPREGGDVHDVAREEMAKPLVLHEEDRSATLRELPGKGGLAGGHLPTEKVEGARFRHPLVFRLTTWRFSAGPHRPPLATKPGWAGPLVNPRR